MVGAGSGNSDALTVCRREVAAPARRHAERRAGRCAGPASGAWHHHRRCTIEVPIFEPGQPPLIIPAQTGAAG
jgi:hypothetical protein